MSNPYTDYYYKQIGTGIPGFRGLRYQRGHGLLSSLISKAIVPLFRTIRHIDPSAILRTAADVLKGPGLTQGKPLADDIARIGATATGALINQLQQGKGRRYKGRVRRRRQSLKQRAPKRLHRPRKCKLVKRKSSAKKALRKQRITRRKKSRKAIDALGY